MYTALAVVDRDSFEAPAAHISEATVSRTYVEGDCVFRRD
jgi:predicted amidohydrolase YtcJ